MNRANFFGLRNDQDIIAVIEEAPSLSRGEAFALVTFPPDENGDEVQFFRRAGDGRKFVPIPSDYGGLAEALGAYIHTLYDLDASPRRVL